METRRRWFIVAAVVFATVLLAVGVWLLRAPLAAVFRDPETLRGTLHRYGAWAPLAFMALQAAQVIVAPIPGHILALAAGALFGPWRGAAYSALGVGAGSGIVLVLSRLLGRPWMRRMLPESAQARVDGWATRHGPAFFFLLFMMPFMPDDLACFAVGFSPLPLAPMLGLIVLARLPGHIAMAWLGATAHRLSWIGWVAILAPGAILLLFYARHRRAIEAWILRRLERVDRGRAAG
jgi:uncharacterized membrane protein YdjX (TVP38/TMEM64 family)